MSTHTHTENGGSNAVGSGVVTLPSGRRLDLYRSRWEGVLDHEELRFCREHGIAVGYDCAQIGWVTQMCTDDPITPVGEPTASAGASALQSDPEQEAIRLRGELEAEAARLLQSRGDQPASGEAIEQLESTALAASRRFAATHDVNAADLFHWAAHTVVAGAVAAVRGPRHELPAETEAFTFRPWAPDDAAVHMELLGNPNVWEHLPEPFPAPFTMETAHTLIEVAAMSFKHDTVAVEVDGAPIGQCVLRFDRPFAGSRAAEVAYWLGEAHWGRGWMSRVLPAFTLRSIRRHPVDVVYAWIKPENEASVRVAERAGYQRDNFPHESELAELRGRAGFVRYATYRADWPA